MVFTKRIIIIYSHNTELYFESKILKNQLLNNTWFAAST